MHIYQQACEYLNKTPANRETKSLIHGETPRTTKKMSLCIYLRKKIMINYDIFLVLVALVRPRLFLRLPYRENILLGIVSV